MHNGEILFRAIVAEDIKKIKEILSEIDRNNVNSILFKRLTEDGLNLFQSTMIDGNTAVIDAFFNHAIEHKYDLSKLVRHTLDKFLTGLLQSLTIDQILNTCTLNYQTPSSKNYHKTRLKVWKHADASANGSVKDEHLTDNQIIDLLKDDEIIELTFGGPIYAIKTLLAKGLITTQDLTQNCSLKEEMEALVGSSKDLEEWNWIKKAFCFSGLDNPSEPKLDAKGRVTFETTIKNRLGIRPLRFRITLDFSELDALVNPKPSDAIAPLFNAVHERVGRLSNAQKKQEAELKKLEKYSPEFQKNERRPSDDIQNQVYERVYDVVIAKFDAEKKKLADVFAAKLTDGSAKAVSSIGILIKSIVSHTPILGGLLSEASGAISGSAAESIQMKHDVATYEKVVGANLNDLAINIALRLSDRVPLDQAINAARVVNAQYDSIQKYDGKTEEDLLNFFCKSACERFAPKKGSNSSHSTGSTSISSNSNEVVVFSGFNNKEAPKSFNDFKQERKAAAAGCCVTM